MTFQVPVDFSRTGLENVMRMVLVPEFQTPIDLPPSSCHVHYDERYHSYMTITIKTFNKANLADDNDRNLPALCRWYAREHLAWDPVKDAVPTWEKFFDSFKTVGTGKHCDSCDDPAKKGKEFIGSLELTEYDSLFCDDGVGGDIVSQAWIASQKFREDESLVLSPELEEDDDDDDEDTIGGKERKEYDELAEEDPDPDNTKRSASPASKYTKLYGEGRSVHNGGNSLMRRMYGHILGKGEDVPSVESMKEKMLEIMASTDKGDTKHRRFIRDMQVTKVGDLWPDQDHPTPNVYGRIWYVASRVLLGKKNFQDAEYEADPDASYDLSPETIAKRGKKSRGGRVPGTHDWKEPEMNAALDIILEVKPVGQISYGIVAEKLLDRNIREGRHWGRTANGIQSMFDKLVAKKGPTGKPYMNLMYKRARDITQEIAKAQVAGEAALNNDSVPIRGNGVKGTHLADGKGTMIRVGGGPPSKGTKAVVLADSVRYMADGQKSSIQMLSGNISALTNAIVGGGGGGGDPAVLGRLDRVEATVAGIRSDIDRLLDHFGVPPAGGSDQGQSAAEPDEEKDETGAEEADDDANAPPRKRKKKDYGSDYVMG